MNNAKVKLPFGDLEIEQLAEGHGVTEAADFLQSTIINNTEAKALKGLELGSGNGIVTFMLALQRPDWQLTGIELQPELYELSFSNNKKIGQNCRFILGDLREFRTQLEFKEYDLIYSNPPWIKAGSGKISSDEIRNVSRQEITCSMKDILICTDWCLSPEGSAWLVYPMERKAELTNEMMRINLEAINLYHSELYPHLFVTCLKRKPMSQSW